MKFTGELKNKLEAAESKEEVSRLLKDRGIELTEEELESIAGGSGVRIVVDFSVDASPRVSRIESDSLVGAPRRLDSELELNRRF